MLIGTAIADDKVKFLSSVAFTGRIPITIIAVDPVNVSFAIAPVLKNVLLV